MKNKIFIGIVAFMSIGLYVSCDPVDTNYKKYLEGGETQYISKPLGVSVKSGKGRVQISWSLTTGYNVDEAVIVYDNDKQLVVPITGDSDTQKSVIISGLSEEVHFFKIFTRNSAGNKSLLTGQFSALVYGSKYQSGLISRKFQNINVFSDGSAKVVWAKPFSQTIMTHITYKDKSGILHTLDVENENSSTDISNFDPKGGLSVVSDYLPEGSLDSFTSNEFKTTAIKIALDKSLFKLVNLPGDIPRLDPSVPAAEKDWLHAWDGNNSTVKAYLEANAPKPSYITLDLGVKMSLAQLDIVGFLPFTPITPKKYQVWGIGDDKDINSVATTVNIHDISSLSAADKADPVKVAAKKAENFEAWKTESQNKGWTLLIDDNRLSSDERGFSRGISSNVKVRYVRLVFIGNFSSSNPDIGMNEITFYGLIPTE